MTADVETLVRACLDAPADDTARLVLADLLREHPDPGYQRAGRFVWSGVAASRFRGVRAAEDPDLLVALGEMGAVTGDHAPPLLRALGLGCGAAWTWRHECDTITVSHRPGRWAVFTRGMLSGLRVPLGEWQALAPLLAARVPLEWVECVDVPGLRFEVLAPDGLNGWCLQAKLEVKGRARLVRVPDAADPSDDVAVAIDRPASWSAVWSTHDRRRDALVAGINPAIDELVGRLRGQAGDRWPRGRPARGDHDYGL